MWNCFDMGYESLACSVKESTKLYFHSLRAAHIEKAKTKQIKFALTDTKSQGMAQSLAEKHAEKEGAKAAKLALQKAQCGAIREGGSLFGSYVGGFFGEQRLGRLGFLMGSQMGSWFGGRIGLILYDTVNATHFLINLRN
ncbi:hypothetical protein HN51_069406 [Arachis hypogaea]